MLVSPKQAKDSLRTPEKRKRSLGKSQMQSLPERLFTKRKIYGKGFKSADGKVVYHEQCHLLERNGTGNTSVQLVSKKEKKKKKLEGESLFSREGLRPRQ